MGTLSEFGLQLQVERERLCSKLVCKLLPVTGLLALSLATGTIRCLAVSNLTGQQKHCRLVMPTMSLHWSTVSRILKSTDLVMSTTHPSRCYLQGVQDVPLKTFPLDAVSAVTEPFDKPAAQHHTLAALCSETCGLLA